MVPLSSCTFNVCASYAHFHFFPYKFQLNENAKALCLYCTDSKGKNICVKAIQWDKLWYDFPVFIVSHYGEQAVSFEKVDLPESLLTDSPVTLAIVLYVVHTVPVLQTDLDLAP